MNKFKISSCAKTESRLQHLQDNLADTTPGGLHHSYEGRTMSIEIIVVLRDFLDLIIACKLALSTSHNFNTTQQLPVLTFTQSSLEVFSVNMVVK